MHADQLMHGKGTGDQDEPSVDQLVTEVLRKVRDVVDRQIISAQQM